MTKKVAVNDGCSPMWIAEVDEWRRVLEAHGWTARRYAYGRGRWNWVWQEPDLDKHDDEGDSLYAYTEAFEEYALPISWWANLDEDERETMPEFQVRPDIGRRYWVAPFGPSEE